MRRALSKLLVVGVATSASIAAAQTVRLPSITSDSSPANQLENSDIQFQSIVEFPKVPIN